MKPIFQSHLKFRDKGEHGQCDICHNLRSKIRKAGNKQTKQGFVHTYTRHLLSQWLDRSMYWTLRQQSRTFFAESLHFGEKLKKSSAATSVLACIQDGMDQSKLRVPRRGYQQSSKAFSKIFRPACHLVGTFIHGFKLNLSLSDEDLKKDSVTSIELIARGLSEVVQAFGQLPLQIHLQQDNCYREGKNRYMVAFFLLLQILGVAKYTSLGFCRVGHSHEDIDQCFGQLSRLLVGKAFSTPDEMLAILAEVTGAGKDTEGRSGKIRGSYAVVQKVDETACWKAFVAQAGVVLKGLRRVHYFRFCARRDLGSDVLDNVHELEELPRKWTPHADDTFVITKRYMADTQIQRAIAVVPASVAQQIRGGFQPPAGVAPRRAISAKVRKNLDTTVPPCLKSGELSKDGAQYLTHWSRGTLPRTKRPEKYEILNYRYLPQTQPHHPGAWSTPSRVRHFDVGLERDSATGDVDDDESSDSNGEIDLPIELDSWWPCFQPTTLAWYSQKFASLFADSSWKDAVASLLAIPPERMQ